MGKTLETKAFKLLLEIEDENEEYSESTDTYWKFGTDTVVMNHMDLGWTSGCLIFDSRATKPSIIV